MPQFKKTPAHSIEGLDGLNLEQQLQDHELRLKGVQDKSADHETRITDLELKPHGDLEVGGHLASQIKSDADLNVPAASGRTLEDYLIELRRSRGGYPDLAARLSAMSGKAFKRTWSYADDFRDPANTLTNMDIEPMGGDDAALRLSSVFGNGRTLDKATLTDWQRTQPRNAVVGNGLNGTDNTSVKFATLRFAPVSVRKVRMVVTSNGGFRTVGGWSQLGLAEFQAWNGIVQAAGSGQANLEHPSYPATNATDGVAAAGATSNSYFAPFDYLVTPLSPVMLGLVFGADTSIDRVRFAHTDAQTGRQPRDFEIQFSTDEDAQIGDDPRSPRWFGLDLSNGTEDGSEKVMLADAGGAAALEARLVSLPGNVVNDHFDVDTRNRFSSALTVGVNSFPAEGGYLRLGNGTMTPHAMGMPDAMRDGTLSLTFTAGSAFDQAANSTCGFALQFRGYGAITQTSQPGLGYQFKLYAVKGAPQAKAVLQYWSGSAWVNAVPPVDVQGVAMTSGVTYALKVDARGSVLRGYVDGVQVLSWTDVFGRYMSGQAGFVAWGMTEARVTDFLLDNQDAPYGQRTNLQLGESISLANNGADYFTTGRWISEPIYLEGDMGGVLKALRWNSVGSGVTLSYRMARVQKTQSYRNVALASLGASARLLSGQPLETNEVPANLIKGVRRPWDGDGTVFATDLRGYAPGASGEQVSVMLTLNGAHLVSKVVNANVDIYGAKKMRLWAGLSENELKYVGEYDLSCPAGPGTSAATPRLFMDEIRFKPVYAQVLKVEWTPNPNRISGAVNASNQFNTDFLAIAALEVYTDAVGGLDRATWFQLQTPDRSAVFNYPASSQNRWLQLRADLSGDGSSTPQLTSFRSEWSDLMLPGSGSAILRLDSGARATRHSKLSYLLGNLTPGASGVVSYRVGDVLDDSLPWCPLPANTSYSSRNVAYAGNGGWVTYVGSKGFSSARWGLYRSINGVDRHHPTDYNLTNLTQLVLAGGSAPEVFVVKLDSLYTISAVNAMGDGIYGPKQLDLEFSMDGVTYESLGSHPMEVTASQRNDNLVRFSPVLARYVKFSLTPNRTDYLDIVQLKVWGDGVSLAEQGRYLEVKADLVSFDGTSPRLLEVEVEYQIDPSAANAKSILGLSIDLDRARFEFHSYKQKRQYGLAYEDLDFLLDDSHVVSWTRSGFAVYDSIEKCLTLVEAVSGDAIRLKDVTGDFSQLVLLANTALQGGSATLQLVGVTEDPVPQTILRTHDLTQGISATWSTDFASCARITPTLYLTGRAQLKSWGIVHA